MSGGQRPVINLKGPNQFLKTETLQDGRSSFTPRQAWGNYTMQVINCNCNYLDLMRMQLQLQLQYLYLKHSIKM